MKLAQKYINKKLTLFCFFKKIKLVIFLFPIFLFLISASPAAAASLYFWSNGSDTNWTTIGNWWTAADHAGGHEGTVPTGSDAVTTVGTNGPNVNLATWTQPSSINALATGITFSSALFSGISINVIGSTTFSGSSYNLGGTVIGPTTFNDSGANYGNITGTTTLNGSNVNFGTIIGPATFNGTSYNWANITGTTTFNGLSYNQGTITGDATFNTTWYNGTAPLGNTLIIGDGKFWGGTVTGTLYSSDHVPITNYEFDGSSYIYNGNITGDVTMNSTWFNGTAPSGGTITIGDGKNWAGNVSGTIYGSDDIPITDYVFNASSNNGGGIIASTTFNGSSVNNGTVTGTTTFNVLSYNYGTVIGTTTFNGTSYNNSAGTIIGSTTFNGSSRNEGNITGTTTFSDLSYNYGTITGTAIFTDAIGGVMTVPDGGQWGSGTATSVVGSDGAPITQWIFDGTSANYGTIIGPVVFNGVDGVGLGGNAGTITGITTFNRFSANAGVINGPVTFEDLSINAGTVNGNATFNASSTNYISIEGEDLGGIVNGDATFNGDLSENSSSTPNGIVIGTVTGAKTRYYNTVISPSPTRDLTGWTVMADGVQVDASGTQYNETTTFKVTNNGSFLPSSIVPIVIPVPPTLSTSAASSVATSTLIMNANISSNGGANATEHGFAYGTTNNLSTVIATTTGGTFSGTGDFTSTSARNISGLTPNTTYYFRAYAVNSAGTSTGSILSTTTLAVSAPTVTTQAVSDITVTSATANGNITITGYINPTVRGAVYGQTTAYGATTTPATGDFSTGAFTASITGLTCNTLYHVAAYAANSQGTSYGDDITFTTSDCTVTTVPGSSGSVIYLLQPITRVDNMNNPPDPSASAPDSQDGSLLSGQNLVDQIFREAKSIMAGNTETRLTNFISNGTPTSLILGSGERAGVIKSFQSAYGKPPQTASDWADVLKIANGRWPNQRNAKTEKNAEAAFRKIYQRSPNRNNSSDDAAVTVISYGLRPANRNLNSERAAIKSFMAIYGHAPKSAMAWDIIRAIAYSGAKR